MRNKVDWRGRPLVPESRLATSATVIAVWGGLLALYQFVFPLFVTDEKRRLFVPSLIDIFAAGEKLGCDLLLAALDTGLRAGLGFVVGSVLGIGVALVAFRYRIARTIAIAIAEGFRPLPPVALTVFVLLWFKLSYWGPVVLIALGCFMVLLVGADAALLTIDVGLVRSARSLGSDGWCFFTQVVVPAIAPHLKAPLRVSLALAFAVTISAEFLGAHNGLGTKIMAAKIQLDTAAIILLLAVLALEAKLADVGLLRALAWYTHDTSA